MAVTWACERFRDYLVGLHFHIETDHKPLVPLLTSKNLDELPIRVQRFRLRLMRFSFSMSHVPGKELVLADTLSRVPVSNASMDDKQFQQEVEVFVDSIIHQLPASEQGLHNIMEHQHADETCQQLVEFCRKGWPSRSCLRRALKSYLPVSNELTVHNGLLLRGNRLVIPTALRQEILQKIHSGHLGITKCRERARHSVWWPGLGRELENLIRKCPVCCKYQLQHAEPLCPSRFPAYPWQKVGADLFQWKQATYLLVIDYFSRYIKIAKISGTTAIAVISQIKSIFAQHGVPQELFSDNGPQFSSGEFAQLAKEYDFTHSTSSPRYPQANGEAERAVRTVKNILKKNEDPYFGLMVYRATPLENGYSPTELLMGRKLRTTIPAISEQLKPRLPDYSRLREK